MVAEVRPEYDSRWAATCAVSGKLGIGSAETLRTWVRRAEVDAGRRPGLTNDQAAEITRLKRETAELRRANEMARRSSRFSCSSSLIRLTSADIRPGSTPSSISACLTQVRSDSTRSRSDQRPAGSIRASCRAPCGAVAPAGPTWPSPPVSTDAQSASQTPLRFPWPHPRFQGQEPPSSPGGSQPSYLASNEGGSLSPRPLLNPPAPTPLEPKPAAPTPAGSPRTS